MGEVCDGESRGWEKCAVASAGEGAVRDGGGSEGGSSAMVRVRAEGGSDVLWLEDETTGGISCTLSLGGIQLNSVDTCSVESVAFAGQQPSMSLCARSVSGLSCIPSCINGRPATSRDHFCGLSVSCNAGEVLGKASCTRHDHQEPRGNSNAYLTRRFTACLRDGPPARIVSEGGMGPASDLGSHMIRIDHHEACRASTASVVSADG